MNRRAVSFQCAGEQLCGVLEEPAAGVRPSGVVVVTGGPQYRVGSHRQFVELTTRLAADGYACLRFDQRGSGDSGGGQRPFDRLDDDIRAAIDCLLRECPGVERVVLWGLCDAASAALIYAPTDTRVGGLVLLNPWVRREQTEARARIDHYYSSRLRDRRFWWRLLTGRVRVMRALGAYVRKLLVARRRADSGGGDFVDRMLAGAEAFDGRVLLVLSGQDLTAQEFSHIAASGPWSRWVDREAVSVAELEPANHTFSRQVWKDAVADRTAAWLDADR